MQNTTRTLPFSSNFHTIRTIRMKIYRLWEFKNSAANLRISIISTNLEFRENFTLRNENFRTLGGSATRAWPFSSNSQAFRSFSDALLPPLAIQNNAEKIRISRIPSISELPSTFIRNNANYRGVEKFIKRLGIIHFFAYFRNFGTLGWEFPADGNSKHRCEFANSQNSHHFWIKLNFYEEYIKFLGSWKCIIRLAIGHFRRIYRRPGVFFLGVFPPMRIRNRAEKVWIYRSYRFCEPHQLYEE